MFVTLTIMRNAKTKKSWIVFSPSCFSMCMWWDKVRRSETQTPSKSHHLWLKKNIILSSSLKQMSIETTTTIWCTTLWQRMTTDCHGNFKKNSSCSLSITNMLIGSHPPSWWLITSRMTKGRHTRSQLREKFSALISSSLVSVKFLVDRYLHGWTYFRRLVVWSH